jgi:hypothetical protein
LAQCRRRRCTVQAPQRAMPQLKLCAGQAEHVGQHLEKRLVAADINRSIDAVDLDRGGHTECSEVT